MSEDSYTEVTEQSWGSRLGNSVKGMLFGLVLFVVAFPVLFKNEGRAVKRYRGLKEGAGAVVSVSADAVEASDEGKLVHITGKAETSEELKDEVFNVAATAISLTREVEMYQWAEDSRSETRKKLGGGTEKITTYDYNKKWSGSLIASSGFKKPEGHQNPATMPWQAKTFSAKKVTVGAYTLSPGLTASISKSDAIAVTAEMAAALSTEEKPVHAVENALYAGADPTVPVIGDVRVRFRAVPPAQVSVVAKQIGDTFEPYVASNGEKISLLKEGTFSAESMFQAAQASNKKLTWIIRFVGFLLMLIGLSMILKPLSVSADVLPFLGSLVAAGTGIVAAGIAAVCSLVTIAIAWIVYRPLLGISLLVVAGAIGAFVLMNRKKQ